MVTKAKAKSAGDRWQVKLGNSSAYERFLCAGHLIYWTGKDVKSVEVATGTEVGKAKADNGRPWAVGEEVWIPTKKGFEIRTATLAPARTIAVPAPKGTQFLGAGAYVHDNVAYRVTRSTAVTKVGTKLEQAYSLYAYDLSAKKERYHTLLKNTSYPQVSGVCSRDR